MILSSIVLLISLLVGSVGLSAVLLNLVLPEEKMVVFSKISEQLGFPLFSLGSSIIFLSEAGLLFLLSFLKQEGIIKNLFFPIATTVLVLVGTLFIAGFRIEFTGLLPVSDRPIVVWNSLILSLIGVTAIFFPRSIATTSIFCGAAVIVLSAIGFFLRYSAGPLFSALLGIGFILKGIQKMREETVIY